MNEYEVKVVCNLEHVTPCEFLRRVHAQDVFHAEQVMLAALIQEHVGTQDSDYEIQVVSLVRPHRHTP